MAIQPGKKRHPLDREVTHHYFHLNEYLVEISIILDKKVTELDNYEEQLRSEGTHASVPEYVRQMYSDAFITILYNSTFIAGYSLFETALKKYCQLAEEISGTKMKKKKSEESHIQQYHIFLRNDVPINLSAVQAEYEALDEYRQIRNCFTHQQGNVFDNQDKPINEQKAYQAASNNSDLEFNQTTGDIKIKSGSYVQYFAMQSKTYLDCVIDNLVALQNSTTS